MATGDIGTLIDHLDYLNDIPQLVRISATIYAVVQRISSSLRVYTFSCDAAGQISNAALDYETLVPNAVAGRTMFHVSGNVWAIAYKNNVSGSYYEKVVTFTVDPTTGAISPAIANTAITPQGSSYYFSVNWMQPAVLPVDGNTMFALFGITLHSGYWMAVKTFTVSNDGASIAGVALLETAGVSTIRTASPIQLATNYFAAVASGSNTTGHNYLYTYNITNAGAITLINSLDLGTGWTDSNDNTPGICHVSGDVWLICFTNTAGSKTLETISITETGVIGAVIDTDAALIPYRENYLKNINDSFFLVISGQINAEMMRTFSIATDGTIGATIDSYSPPSTFGFYGNLIFTGVGNLYVGQHRSTVGSTVVNFSIDIITPDPDIETLDADEIKHDRATLWGNVIEVGGASELGFDWSLSTGDFDNEVLADSLIPGLFNLEITGLTYNTYYKFRAKIRRTGGAWFYGDEVTFSTTFPVPQVRTEPASATADHYIDAVGCLMSDGGAVAVDEYGFAYGCSTIEDMLGLFDADLDKQDDPNICTGPFDYDACEKVVGTLVAPLLSGNAASGQKNVSVVSASGIVAGQQFMLMDDDNEETLTVDHVVGLVVTMTTNLVSSYTTANSARLCQLVTIRLRNLEYGKRYYYRFWAHNQYGWGWGSEMCSLTSDTVNLIIPTATASQGIRFCIPGKVNFPPTGMYYNLRHHLLVRSPDSRYISPAEGGGTFGWVTGKYVCERQYWYEATNVDLYTMSNPTKRTGTIIKVKYKTRIGNNSYGLGAYHKRVINNGASSLTSAYIGASGNPGWYCEIFYDNPWTSAPWDITETDDLQMGISIRSGTGWEIPMCDCIEGRVIWANAAVTTKTAYQLSPTVTRFRALVTEDEAEDCEVYFEYGPTAAYGSSTTPQAAVKGGYVYADIASPPAGAEYHYRAVIETDCGETFYGADKSYPNRMYLELAFEQSILTVAPVWTDVTPYCMKLHTQRGRNHELDRCDAGTGTFLLNNASGDWWRLNTVGTFYGVAGGVKPLTLVRLRYVYDDEFFLFYGVAESFKPGWLSKGSGFHPIIELKAVDVFKSFTRYKIVDANPVLIENATTGEDFVYVDSTRGLVEGQSIRIYEGDTTQTTTILQIVASQNLVIFDDVLATDFSTNAKLKKFPTVLSGRRIQDILLEAKWPLALTTIDDGQVMVVELTPGTGGDNVMDELYKTQEAECGNLFVAGNGKVTFQDSIAMTKSPFNTSQGTFKDDGTNCKFYDPELSDDDEFIYNESNISGDAIGEQIMLDSDAQDDQGPRSLDRKDSRLSDPDDAFDQVTINVERYKESIQRCSGLIIRPEGDPDDSWPRVLGYGLGTRITLQLNSTRNPAMIDIDRHVMGITQDWSVWDPWETRWQLWDVNNYYVFRSLHEGWVRNVWPEPYTYTDIHDDPTAAFVENDTEEPIEIGQLPYVAFSYNEDIRRGQLEVDTTKIDAGWTIASAKIILMLKPQLILYDRKTFNLCVVGTYNSNQPVVLADYGNMLGQTTIYGSVSVPSTFREPDPFHPVGVYLIAAIELNAAGIAHINKGGTSRFWLRSDNDINAVEPTDGESEHVLIEGHLGAFPPRLLVKLS